MCRASFIYYIQSKVIVNIFQLQLTEIQFFFCNTIVSYIIGPAFLLWYLLHAYLSWVHYGPACWAQLCLSARCSSRLKGTDNPAVGRCSTRTPSYSGKQILFMLHCKPQPEYVLSQKTLQVINLSSVVNEESSLEIVLCIEAAIRIL